MSSKALVKFQAPDRDHRNATLKQCGNGAMTDMAERNPTTICRNFLRCHHHILYLRSI